MRDEAREITVSVKSVECTGYGNCSHRAPAVFSLPLEANTAEVLDPHPPSSLHDAVRDAERDCPVQAILVR